jgi:hypothetical protein
MGRYQMNLHAFSNMTQMHFEENKVNLSSSTDEKAHEILIFLTLFNEEYLLKNRMH